MSPSALRVAAPDLAARLALRELPATTAVGYQRWSELLFLHWKVDASAVQATLPPGLFVDTQQGEAYLGIVPFFMDRIRPACLPPLPWISWFLELNVRTYVHDADGRPGVWFYSLDCNQPIAVAIARRWFHLPYFHARMSAARHDGWVDYQCERRAESAPASRFAWKPGRESAPAAPGSLAFFLVERYLLFAADRAGRLHTGRVHHAPYRVHNPTVTDFSTAPARQAGFELAGAPDSVLGAEPVNVAVYALRPIDDRGSSSDSLSRPAQRGPAREGSSENPKMPPLCHSERSEESMHSREVSAWILRCAQNDRVLAQCREGRDSFVPAAQPVPLRTPRVTQSSSELSS